MLNKIKAKIPALPQGINKNMVMIGAAAVVLTGAIVISLWRSNQGYVALFGSQENIPVSQVVEVLGAENIAYRINPDNGQLLIDESSLPKARMALAAKGISAVMPSGYELMDKEEMLGSSQFIQNVRYKRSLEGELAQSIMGLDPVEHARVHLGLMESSSFVMSNKPDSSASVVVRLRYGKELNDQQVGAIVQLVAGSIPGMKVANVRVVDQNGTLLSEGFQAGNSNIAGIRQGNDVINRLKADTEKNIANLLSSVVGTSNYRISVVPQVDMSSVEETQERLGGDPRVSNESLNQENTTNELAMGVPGSLSNRPAPPAPAAGAAPADANNNQQALSTRNQAQRNYAYDRDVRHIRHPGYKLEKMTVAIVLNKAAPALAEWTPTQVTGLTKLIEDAAGISRDRGDSLTLDMMVFTAPADIDMPVMTWWQDPSIQRWGEMGGIGFLALLAVLFGVRPVARRFSQVREPVTVDAIADEMPDNKLIEKDMVTTDEGLTQGLPNAIAFQEDNNLPPQSSGLETKVEYMQMLAQRETERVAEVLKQWINSNERDGTKQ
ncbi:MAG: flagellar basal-body MS-ring/collar protein FliF [Hafnia sp.]|uniref:Flagellar M-ring protein n=3 Tax=Obesumbacterium proteus TaxID=82983 RepID=A0AA91EJP5_9GAMM|nr:flagellar basal-body MS-ring/collar protein FliF [Obesumbacterium proteus]AMO80234.1 flagellar MS-ring protein [Obesumbacterium proteus]KKI46306.1 flagellar MS-ring protein [Obesumbacterium proteus]MCE9885424.1 flagellar M-ring protein FliF [Obesumbacterium proteus]MCE9917646.1 flagellar M-ring protein FliF [Obesumbacterium proteus]MCE9930821.1 flagellar M-ring protein FliF [Obesumbacterium proteus]